MEKDVMIKKKFFQIHNATAIDDFIVIVPNLFRYRFQLPNLSMTKTFISKNGIKNNNPKTKNDQHRK